MRFFTVIFLGLGLAATAAHAQTVRLMPRSTVLAGTVHLADIATIEDATPAVREKLAQTVVVARLEGARVIRAEEVLYAVLQQNQTLNLAATLVIRGAAQCSVMPEGASPGIAPAMTVPSADGEPAVAAATVSANMAVDVSVPQPRETTVVPAVQAAAGVAVEAPVSGSLADQITQQVIRDFACNPGDISVEIITADASIKAVPPAGQTWTLRSTMRPSLGTMQWEAKLMNNHLPVKEMWVQAMVKKRAVQVVTLADLERGKVVTADMLRAQTVWLDRDMRDMPTDALEMVGMQTTRAMAAGTSISRHDFQVAQDVQANDMVAVYYVSHGVKVKITAKALMSGRRGDQITLQNGKEVVKATVIGPRLASLSDLDAAAIQQLREIK